jgi:hypothetical protein
MALPSNYKKGDKMCVVAQIELEELLSIYGNSKAMKSQDVAELADKVVTILWVPSRNEINSWDGWIPVKTDKQMVYNLPFAALLEVSSNGFVEEPEDREPEVYIIRDRESENNLVQLLAAETIQTAFRLNITFLLIIYFISFQGVIVPVNQRENLREFHLRRSS